MSACALPIVCSLATRGANKDGLPIGMGVGRVSARANKKSSVSLICGFIINYTNKRRNNNRNNNSKNSNKNQKLYTIVQLPARIDAIFLMERSAFFYWSEATLWDPL